MRVSSAHDKHFKDLFPGVAAKYESIQLVAAQLHSTLTFSPLPPLDKHSFEGATLVQTLKRLLFKQDSKIKLQFKNTTESSY